MMNAGTYGRGVLAAAPTCVLALLLALVGIEAGATRTLASNKDIVRVASTAAEEPTTDDLPPSADAVPPSADTASPAADAATPTANVPAPIGWVEDETGERRFYDPVTHEPHTGWLIEGGGDRRFWLKPEDGTMASHEWVEIDGLWQPFDDDGTWLGGAEVIPPDDAQNVANMSPRQRAVVDACDTTPWPGRALCAAWVSQVFQNAGEPAVDGDACDIANAWCTSDDLSQLKPGMVIAVPSHERTENGKIWGHVCIYVGDGLVRDSGSYAVRRVRLGAWLTWFGTDVPPKWGWANALDLTT